MIDFDEEKQVKRLEEIKEQEEEDLVRILAEARYGLPSIDLGAVIIENEALRAVTEKEAHDFEIGPFKILGKNLHVALRAPERPEIQAIKERMISEGYVPHFYMASSKSLQKVWDRYKELSYAANVKAGGLDITGDTLIALGQSIKTIKDVTHTLEEADKDTRTHKISRMLEIILAGAISINASDIHIEPEEDRIRLRYRLDGALQDVLFFSGAKFKLLNSRIKLLSGLKLVSNIAQDGRFSIFLRDEEISIRTSLIPGAYGESIVMRILNPKSIQVKFEDLGIPDELFGILDREIRKPNGLMLVTGPTGSGKTTTLYAFLRRIYSAEVKIITIEDPIEYHLAGVTQTQVEQKKGYTFAAGLRAALRQDPDVIMVGEIRDKETAEIAIESALTGHLVFSTLHTNNAQGVIPRLIDLGVNPKIIPSALSVSMAQRLVRKLCVKCKKVKTGTEEEIIRIRTVLKKALEEGKHLDKYGVSPDQDIVLYEAVGCEACNFLGYKGRLGIYEAILSDEAIEKIIITNPSEREIKIAAQHQGILDMKEDGVVKVVKGITTLEEVESVVDFEED